MTESALDCKFLSMFRKAVLNAEPADWFIIAMAMKSIFGEANLDQKRKYIKMTNSPELKSFWIGGYKPNEVLDLIMPSKEWENIDSELLSLSN